MTENFIVVHENICFSKKDVVAVVLSADLSSYSVYLRGGHKLDIYKCSEDDINNIKEFFEKKWRRYHSESGQILGINMKEILVHQWRDWLLKYVGDGEYELINKDNLSVKKITAKNFMDAENQSQLVIRDVREGKGQTEILN